MSFTCPAIHRDSLPLSRAFRASTFTRLARTIIVDRYRVSWFGQQNTVSFRTSSNGANILSSLNDSKNALIFTAERNGSLRGLRFRNSATRRGPRNSGFLAAWIDAGCGLLTVKSRGIFPDAMITRIWTLFYSFPSAQVSGIRFEMYRMEGGHNN